MLHDWSGTYSIHSFHQELLDRGCYPPIENLIESQINFFHWWYSADSGFIIRHSREHKKFELSVLNGTEYFSSDNEACASFYESIFRKSIEIPTTLFDLFKENKFKVGIKVDKSLGFTTGMSNGPCRQSGLKLSHFIDAAKNLNVFDGPKKRCAIYLSPLNIFLTPKPLTNNGIGYSHCINEYGLHDIGEDDRIKALLHGLLINHILTFKNGPKAVQFYCQMCEIDFKSIVNETKDLNKFNVTFSKNVNKHIPRVEIKSTVNNLIINKPRFYIDEAVYEDLLFDCDAQLVINVMPKKGKHPKGTYLIPNNVALNFIESKRKSPNWIKYKNFHQDGIPSQLTTFFNEDY